MLGHSVNVISSISCRSVGEEDVECMEPTT